MDTVTQTRLVKLARARGLKVYRHRVTGAYFVSSASTPGAFHAIAADGSCDCQGFAHHSRCTHVAAYLAATATPAVCGRCQGTGRVKVHGFDGWDRVSCPVCYPAAYPARRAKIAA